MSKLNADVISTEYGYSPDQIKQLKGAFEKSFKPPYTLALEEYGNVYGFQQIQHADIEIMAGLVMEMNAGRAGHDRRNKTTKRRWLLIDSDGGQHTMGSNALLKVLGNDELRRRNRVYRIVYKDTGKQGYVGPMPEVGQITDPGAVRIMQSQLFAKVKTSGVKHRFLPRYENGKVKTSTHRF